MHNYSEKAHQQSIKQRLRSRNNGFVEVNLAGNETIPAMFERQVLRHVAKPAIVSTNRQITYGELDQISRSIASGLRKKMDDLRLPVAILITDHVNFVAATLGVLRCGGFYVPLDPSFPEDRNARILQESRAQYILAEGGNQKLAQILAVAGQKVIYLDEILGDEGDSKDASKPHDLACLIFTSGSTGKPKGVMQTHRNIGEIVTRYTNGLFLGSEDRVSLLSSFSVTASIGTIFGSLLNGATLYPFSVKEEGLNKLANWLDAERITVYRSVPSLFRHLMDSVAPERIFPSVQIVRLGGDSLHKRDWELYKQHFPAESALINFYGCSEMSTASRFYMDAASRPGDGVLPVGFALDGVQISVVDTNGHEHCVNEDGPEKSEAAIMGEIVLRSRHLAPGYWNDPASTDAAFSSDAPDYIDLRVYRTGDVGSLRREQGLIHVGRADQQVKISGFRVEIAETEACLLTYPGVKEAAVLLDRSMHEEGELIGFVVMASGYICDKSDIRAHVQGRVPTHMAPSEVIAVERIPCTPNGKVDRAALISLREEAWRRKARLTARTPTEEALSDIWREVLKVDLLGVEDNFFELGGNSLLAMKLVAKTVERFPVSLRVLAVFQYPTIATMARVVETLLCEGSRSASEDPELMEGSV